MGFIGEFRDFAMKGNVVDMAVGIIIGGAFGTIVKSMVSDVLMPPIGLALGGVDFADKKIVLKEATTKVVEGESVDVAAVTLNWGVFVNNVISFLIVAFCVFLLIKAMNTAKKRFEKEQEEAAPKVPPADVVLLGEIRDLLKKN